MDSESRQVIENQISMAREAVADENWGYALDQLESAARIIEQNTEYHRKYG